jgi:hypothetical protein
MRNRNTRSRVLDVEGLRELLDLTKHEVRALVANNNSTDDFPLGPPPSNHHVDGRRPLSAAAEAL